MHDRFLPTLNGLRTWTLDGSLSPLTPGFEATRTALWTPLLQWCLFLFSRRVYLSLMTWEYETAMNEADIRDENEAKLMYGHGQLVPDFRSKCFQVWIHVLPVMSLCLWEWVLKPRDSTPTDLDVWPGFLWTLLVTLFATWTHRIFLSFQRFSYGCLVWTEPLESGVVLTVLGRTVHYGLIY